MNKYKQIRKSNASQLVISRVSPLIILIIVLFLGAWDIDAQDPLRFNEEINVLMSKDDLPQKDNVILFTGSSSIKFWGSLASDFEGFPVLNRGFGGSQMSDLIYYQDSLIFKYSPLKVFIYEGDNDIAVGKSVEEILADASTLAENIRKKLPATDIYFIAAKPSVARWALREQYENLNRALEQWTLKDSKLHFVDVWYPMCREDGNVRQDIFIADNLHMNARGYEIWTSVMTPFVKSK